MTTKNGHILCGHFYEYVKKCHIYYMFSNNRYYGAYIYHPHNNLILLLFCYENKKYLYQFDCYVKEFLKSCMGGIVQVCMKLSVCAGFDPRNK